MYDFVVYKQSTLLYKQVRYYKSVDDNSYMYVDLRFCDAHTKRTLL